MGRLVYTVDDLVDEVRASLDEDNIDAVSTSRDILPALNRGQDYAWDILSRRYPHPILKQSTLTLSSNTSDYTIPEDCYEDRIVWIDVVVATGTAGNTHSPTEQIDWTEAHRYESTATSSAPERYYIIGRTLRLIPTPTGSYNARLWYIREPEKLVVSQGRIVVINTGSNYVELDAVGSAMSTTADALANYVNVIDGQTGEIKASLQIQTIGATNKRITFRTTASRSTVLGRTISTSIASTIAVDDYLCLIQGTCVPYYSSGLVGFLTQFAVLQIGPTKGSNDALTEDKLLDKFEKKVARSGATRNKALKIQTKSAIWR